MKPSDFFHRRLSLSRLLIAAVIAWIILLTVIILLDPRGSAG
ncbi:hypothetical protein [Nonomuraea sp. NPDC049480]